MITNGCLAFILLFLIECELLVFLSIDYYLKLDYLVAGVSLEIICNLLYVLRHFRM